MDFKTTNPTWEQWDLVWWSTIEVNLSIIVTCLPCLRLILARLWPKILLGSEDSSVQEIERSGAVSSNRDAGYHQGQQLDQNSTHPPHGGVKRLCKCKRHHGPPRLAHPDIVSSYSVASQNTESSSTQYAVLNDVLRIELMERTDSHGWTFEVRR